MPTLMVTRWRFTCHLGHAAILGSTNINAWLHIIFLTPANGAPIAVPSQDMVLGSILYDKRA